MRTAKYGGYFNFYNQLVDVNGDGATDVVGIQSNGTNEIYQYGIWKYNDAFYAVQPSGCRGDFRPCFLYKVMATSPNVLNKIIIRLGNGDGTFGANDESVGVIETRGAAFGFGSINYDKFVSDRQNGTQNYSCVVATIVTSHVVKDYFGPGRDYTVSENDYEYRCPSSADGGEKGLSHANQFADLDGDGYVDIISADASGALKAAYGKGDGKFNALIPLGVTATIDAAKGFRASNQLADMNGDGVTDLFTVSGSTGTPKISSRNQPGLLASITDGNNLVTSITYQPLSNSGAYTKFTGIDAYPLRKLGMPHYVVTASSAAAPGFNYAYGYKYSDARVDLTRGWLGFASMTRIDNNAALESTTAFNQAFPYTGRPSQQTVRHTSAATGKFLSYTTYGWGDRVDSNVNAAGKVHFVYQAGSAQTKYEPNEGYSTATALTTTTAYLNNPVTGNYDASPYDQYGNPEKVQVSYSDGHNLTTVYGSSYASAPASLQLGQLSLRDTTVTHTTPAAETRTRVSRDSYYADGLLQSTATQPNATDINSELKLTTSYSYDGNGRLSTLSTAGADPGGYSAAGSIAANPIVTRQISYNYAAEDVTANTLTVTKTSARI